MQTLDLTWVDSPCVLHGRKTTYLLLGVALIQDAGFTLSRSRALCSSSGAGTFSTSLNYNISEPQDEMCCVKVEIKAHLASSLEAETLDLHMGSIMQTSDHESCMIFQRSHVSLECSAPEDTFQCNTDLRCGLKSK